MKVKKRTNFRVEVYAASSWETRQGGRLGAKAEQVVCEFVASEIKRHVNDIVSAEATWDTEVVCAHCGSRWSEAGSQHNGGCCDKDVEVMKALT